MTIDPVSTGGDMWDQFVDSFNEFCIARGGKPLLNQSPRLTRNQMKTAFGSRLAQFQALREKYDPNERLMNAHFKDLLT